MSAVLQSAAAVTTLVDREITRGITGSRIVVAGTPGWRGGVPRRAIRSRWRAARAFRVFCNRQTRCRTQPAGPAIQICHGSLGPWCRKNRPPGAPDVARRGHPSSTRRTRSGTTSRPRRSPTFRDGCEQRWGFELS
jgi:hypothetical protein